MNLFCFGGWVIGFELAWELVFVFVKVQYSGEECYNCRL